VEVVEKQDFAGARTARDASRVLPSRSVKNAESPFAKLVYVKDAKQIRLLIA
jgi:hypothetical protein